MGRIVRNERGETIEILRGIGEPCDLWKGEDPLTAVQCVRTATREIEHDGHPLFICEEHFNEIAD